MSEEIRRRFFSLDAFYDPLTFWTVLAVVLGVVASGIVILLMGRFGSLSNNAYQDLLTRWKSWGMIAAAILLPILLGSAWVMLAVCILSLLCYKEFARATGLFREKMISLFVVLGIVLVTFAVVDNYARLFFASSVFVVGLIGICTIPQDRPRGYLQRSALGAFGFLLFGYSFGYLGFFANDFEYRPILIMLILGVEMNDIFAYCVGKLVGGPKVLPLTSPGKTWAGCIGALVLTTAFVAVLAHFVFLGTALDRLPLLLTFGIGLSVLGQFGDLLLSSIKRDIGIKDLGGVLPAHGGLLDRFDSLVLVPPAAFHFISLHLGAIGSGHAERILTGGG